VTEGPHTHPHPKPPWYRVRPPVRQLILGEVERQYHPIGTLEYKVRVEWMTDAWQYAQGRIADDRLPSIDDIAKIGMMIEPEVNRGGFRRRDVAIGGRLAPDPSDVLRLLDRLWGTIDRVAPTQGIWHKHAGVRWPELDGVWNGDDLPTWSADDFYLEFEFIHPFGDGNGRTGKILHNWLLGWLGREEDGSDDPVLVFDYFGMHNP
jgi:hypothetical protein